MAKKQEQKNVVKWSYKRKDTVIVCMDEKVKTIHVKMFSYFEMEIDGKTLSDETLHSNMLVKLLVYILCNRKAIISANDLCDVLWREDESDNPIGALKNLLYRLRTILKKTFDENDFIKTLRGAYAWNTDIEVIIDAEVFENKYNEAKQMEDVGKRIAVLEEALDLYTGDFLPKFMSEHWILRQTTYYHSLYISLIKLLAQSYEKVGNYEKMEILCINALKYENLDESIHCLLMKAYIKQRKNSQAKEHYKQTSELLYSQLGTTPSKEMQNLYKEILREIKNEEMNLAMIQDEIATAKENTYGAYFCEYGVFKEIYALQQRQAKRLGIAVYCGLITIESNLDLPLDSNAYRKFRDGTMETLKATIVSSLRSGDVIARYSATQFILLLPTCDYEGGLIALERIEENFYRIATRYHAKLRCDLKEMDLR